jgi:hypothetical protein
VFRCFCLPIALFIIRTLSFILVLRPYLLALPSYSSSCVISVLVVSYLPCLVVFAFFFLYLSSELYLLSWCCALTYLPFLHIRLVVLFLFLLFLISWVLLFLPSFFFIYHHLIILYSSFEPLLTCPSFFFYYYLSGCVISVLLVPYLFLLFVLCSNSRGLFLFLLLNLIKLAVLTAI